MSSLKKIYDLEITPPAGAWENIAREIEALEEDKSISKKLHSLEVTPPLQAWENITAHLDEINQENQLSQKLYNTEALPPAMLWEHISRELDDQRALEVIEKKLADMEVRPPAAAWNHIKNVLEEKQNSHGRLVLPMHHGWLKYAAAACFIAIISITAYFILNDHDSGADNRLAGNPPNTVVTGVPQYSATAGNKKTVSANAGSGLAKEQALAAIRTRLGNAYTISNEKNTELQNRYIILMTPDGNIVRMSKKVGNMADCIAGEDHSCDAQISEWQKEMASSMSTGAPESFLDILDIASEQQGSKPDM